MIFVLTFWRSSIWCYQVRNLRPAVLCKIWKWIAAPPDISLLLLISSCNSLTTLFWTSTSTFAYHPVRFMFRAKKSEPIEIHYKSYQTYQTGPTQLYINEKGRVSTLIHWRGIQIQDTTTRSLANKLCSRNKCVSAWMFRKSLLQSNSADHSQIVSAAARVKMFQITVRRLRFFPPSCICITCSCVGE